jgi:hypothetical protein
MAIAQGNSISGTIIASADLSANQYGGVTAAGAIPAAGALIAGIQQDGGKTGEGPLSGQPVNIVALGFSKVLTNNSAILVGSTITPAGTTGALKLSAAATDFLCGIALEANGSTAGRIISALIVPMGQVTP